MKKLLTTTTIFLSASVLVACSNSQSTSKDNTEQPKTEQKNTTSTDTKAKVDNSKYDDLISEIKSKLDPESTGAISVKIQNNVIDSDSSEPHDAIMILLTGTAKDSVKETLDAVYSNSATTDQNNAITLLRMSISEYAKKLPDDNTTLSLGYEKSADQYDLIAKSSKQKDIIPVGKIILE
ncbi:putative lipoprotein [Streptococcus pneumoniae]|nr:putative lipoprotein [Streptococcus pneumoniae]